MKKRIALLLTVVLAVFIFSACAEPEEVSVVGKWSWLPQQVEDNLSFTFRADGTGLMNSKDDEAAFTYTVEDGKINLTIGDSTESCPFSVDGTQMMLTVNGEALKLTKMD